VSVLLHETNAAMAAMLGLYISL